MPALQAVAPRLAAPAAAAACAGSPSRLRRTRTSLPLGLGPEAPGSRRGCKRLRVAAVAEAERRSGSPPPPGLPDLDVEELRSPATRARREQILRRIDGLIEEELQSQLVGAQLLGRGVPPGCCRAPLTGAAGWCAPRRRRRPPGRLLGHALQRPCSPPDGPALR